MTGILRICRSFPKPCKCLLWIAIFSLSALVYYQHEIMLYVNNYTPYQNVGYSYPAEFLPIKPPDQPAPIVFLHTYMRGGSSILGSIFDRNPNALYYFEPLYGMYQAAMNTEHYNLQPFHIYAYPNGTLRKITQFEEKIVFDRLFDLFDCKMEKLRMEHIANAFVSRSQALKLYEQCMGTFTIGHRSYCTKLTAKQCRGFISDAMKNKCHVFMANVLNDSEAFDAVTVTDMKTESDQNDFISEYEYKLCLEDSYHQHKSCKHLYKERCEFSHLKVAKLVRSNPEFLRRALRMHRDVYIIHQLRDPRGMLSSRKSLGPFMTFDLKTEAKLQCELLYKDYVAISQLQKEYPTQVMILRYEDFAADSFHWTKKIYDFIEQQPPQMVLDSLKRSMNSFQLFDVKFSLSRKDGKATAWSWRNHISKEDCEIIENECKDFFALKMYDL